MTAASDARDLKQLLLAPDEWETLPLEPNLDLMKCLGRLEERKLIQRRWIPVDTTPMQEKVRTQWRITPAGRAARGG